MIESENSGGIKLYEFEKNNINIRGLLNGISNSHEGNK